MDTLSQIAKVCADYLTGQSAAVQLEGDSIKVELGSETHFVYVEDADVEPDETGDGIKLHPRKCVLMLDEDSPHTDVLDACLDALSQSDVEIDDLTTDGDHRDCEAIFDVANYGYVCLKIR